VGGRCAQTLAQIKGLRGERKAWSVGGAKNKKKKGEEGQKQRLRKKKITPRGNAFTIWGIGGKMTLEKKHVIERGTAGRES